MGLEGYDGSKGAWFHGSRKRVALRIPLVHSPMGAIGPGAGRRTGPDYHAFALPPGPGSDGEPDSAPRRPGASPAGEGRFERPVNHRAGWGGIRSGHRLRTEPGSGWIRD